MTHFTSAQLESLAAHFLAPYASAEQIEAELAHAAAMKRSGSVVDLTTREPHGRLHAPTRDALAKLCRRRAATMRTQARVIRVTNGWRALAASIGLA
jgi:hypothetical protein